MITYKQIIEGIEEIFYVVRDIDGKIIEPTDKNIFLKYQEILNGVTYNSEYYMLNEKFYKRIVKTVIDEDTKQPLTIEYFYKVFKTDHNEF